MCPTLLSTVLWFISGVGNPEAPQESTHLLESGSRPAFTSAGGLLQTLASKLPGPQPTCAYLGPKAVLPFALMGGAGVTIYQLAKSRVRVAKGRATAGSNQG